MNKIYTILLYPLSSTRFRFAVFRFCFVSGGKTPTGSILSVRSGPTRRQSPLPCSAPFRRTNTIIDNFVGLLVRSFPDL